MTEEQFLWLNLARDLALQLKQEHDQHAADAELVDEPVGAIEDWINGLTLRSTRAQK